MPHINWRSMSISFAGPLHDADILDADQYQALARRMIVRDRVNIKTVDLKELSCTSTQPKK